MSNEELKTKLKRAGANWDLWCSISNDPDSLEARGKTQLEAIVLAHYYEGKFEGLLEALAISNQQEK